MKSNLWVFAGVGFLIGLAGFVLYVRSNPPAALVDGQVQAAPGMPSGLPQARPLSEQDKKMRALLAKERPALTSQDTKDASPECRSFWNELRATKLDQLLQVDAQPQPLPASSGCGAPPAELAAIHAQYTEACKDLKTTDLMTHADYSTPQVRQCREALAFYRANITEWSTKGMALKDISDPRILSDKLLAQFRTNPASAAEVAERLLEVDPRLYPAAQAALLGRLVSAQGKSSEDKSWEKVDEALKRAKDMDKAKLNEMLEAEMVVEDVRYQNPMRLSEKAKELSQQYPESGAGPYLHAWAEFRRGNVEQASQLLNEAIKRQPQEKKFQDTMNGLRNGKAQPFQVGLSFSDPAQSIQ